MNFCLTRQTTIHTFTYDQCSMVHTFLPIEWAKERTNESVQFNLEQMSDKWTHGNHFFLLTDAHWRVSLGKNGLENSNNETERFNEGLSLFPSLCHWVHVNKAARVTLLLFESFYIWSREEKIHSKGTLGVCVTSIFVHSALAWSVAVCVCGPAWIKPFI